jgi:hypothetical protein
MTGQVLLSPELFYFLYPQTEDIVLFKFRGLGTNVILEHALDFNL